jgi:hypothetical protein
LEEDGLELRFPLVAVAWAFIVVAEDEEAAGVEIDVEARRSGTGA